MSEITPERITADNFAEFGRVVLSPREEPLAADHTFEFWSDIASYLIEGETEVGLCKVFRQDGSPVTWMERHERTPELLIPIDGPFVLPVMKKGKRDADHGGSDADLVQAFQVEVGEAVVIGQNVWHSACHPVGSDEATYFVIFRRGTPAQDVIKTDVRGAHLSDSSHGFDWDPE